MNKALFLDRDGVINIDLHYVSKIEDIVYVEGIFSLMNYFQNLGCKIFVITNQSGVARNFFKIEDVINLHSKMNNFFISKGIQIKEWKICPHLPSDNCRCRKPSTGMLDDIIQEYSIDVNNSYLIGDKISDIQAGNKAGIKNLFILKSEYFSVNSLNELSFNFKMINSLKDVIIIDGEK